MSFNIGIPSRNGWNSSEEDNKASRSSLGAFIILLCSHRLSTQSHLKQPEIQQPSRQQALRWQSFQRSKQSTPRLQQYACKSVLDRTISAMAEPNATVGTVHTISTAESWASRTWTSTAADVVSQCSPYRVSADVARQACPGSPSVVLLMMTLWSWHRPWGGAFKFLKLK